MLKKGPVTSACRDVVERRSLSGHMPMGRSSWCGVVYHVRGIGRWKLATDWWEPDRHSDRTCYRVETPDHQIFELYRDDAQHGGWVLDVCQD